MKNAKWIAAALVGFCLLSGCGSSHNVNTASANSAKPAISEEPVTPAPAGTLAEEQTELILSLQDQWQDSDPYNSWYYCITDLDHNGRLEVITASLQGTGLYTIAHFYEVNETYDGLNMLANPVEEGDSGPDLIQDSAACHLDSLTNTYYYEFIDTLRVNAAEGITTLYVLSLKDGILTETALAHQDDSFLSDTEVKTSYTDTAGNEITQQDYESATATFFGSMQQQEPLSMNWIAI